MIMNRRYVPLDFADQMLFHPVKKLKQSVHNDPVSSSSSSLSQFSSSSGTGNAGVGTGNAGVGNGHDGVAAATATAETAAVAVLMDENLLFEVLKHVDARTLGAAACVSRRWSRTAKDERLWELICTSNWPANIGIGIDQLRAVVLALGGFRCLHSHYLLPLTKPQVSVATSSSSSTVAAATSSSAWPCLPIPTRAVAQTKPAKTRWGKDEIQLSLSLLSIRYFEKLNYNNRNK